jgi:protein-S-isoprenylcysteine O-methyltransferase Ste14
MPSKSRPIADALPATGDLLFRWRSYMPLVLVPLFVMAVDDGRPPAGVPWQLICFFVALSGLAVRGFVVGTAPSGASTRGTSRPTAESLSTQGAYSVVRHPLYLANTLVALGCAMLSGTWYLPLLVVLLSFIYHERIAAREELFLENTFGPAFREWAGQVPAMIPAFARYRPASGPFQLRKVLIQESHGFCAIGTAFLVLTTVERTIRTGLFRIEPFWLTVFAVSLVPFLLVVFVKKSARRMAPI